MANIKRFWAFSEAMAALRLMRKEEEAAKEEQYRNGPQLPKLDESGEN